METPFDGASSKLRGLFDFTFSKSVSFKLLIHFAIAAGVIATLAYLGYRDETSAIVLSLVFGAVAMIIQLTFLDLAARACPKQAEATFFAFLVSVYNGAVQISQITGGWLYDWGRFHPADFHQCRVHRPVLVLGAALEVGGAEFDCE